MFKNTFQSGFLSILYSLGTKPLQIWDKEVYIAATYARSILSYVAAMLYVEVHLLVSFHLWLVSHMCSPDIFLKSWVDGDKQNFFAVVNGQVRRLQDEDIQSNVLEIIGSNVQSTYITCPADPNATLGIKLSFLVMIVKNLKKYFSFEIQILDDKNVRRRFRASNFQSVTRVKPFICTMPISLEDGWNNIQLNLTDLTRRAYGTNYVETLRVQVHANCRLRRIYFSDRLYSEEELPPELKLYLPMQKHNT
ncbi:hypothetical protein ZIOFF_044153 [Zingiber officinale]|uniref:CFA20 domain-containing protein n=1 Tax=Zingiber officinale TaxID=94328 RepID=A0A8J5GBL7_ZINOF|nr:hypothetical protein ZIOFF_044153 [Zingiber officinale]